MHVGAAPAGQQAAAQEAATAAVLTLVDTDGSPHPAVTTKLREVITAIHAGQTKAAALPLTHGDKHGASAAAFFNSEVRNGGVTSHAACANA